MKDVKNSLTCQDCLLRLWKNPFTWIAVKALDEPIHLSMIVCEETVEEPDDLPGFFVKADEEYIDL